MSVCGCVCISTICVQNSASVVNFVFVGAEVSRKEITNLQWEKFLPCLCVAPKIAEIEKMTLSSLFKRALSAK